MTNLTISRLKSSLYQHSWVQKWVHPWAVKRYLKQWAAAGPRTSGKFLNVVILNHCYDQDIDAICKASDGESIWVLDASRIFKVAQAYIPGRLIDQNLANEDPRVAPHIARYIEKFIKPLAQLIIDTTHLNVFLAPSDTFFWLRPLITELKSHGIPTVIQDKEGTVSSNPIMDDHAIWVKATYPPLSDYFVYWNSGHQIFGNKMGSDPSHSIILGQPRSDYFFHPERWPSRSNLGLPKTGKVLLFFTFSADAYAATGINEGKGIKPWRPMRSAIMRSLVDIQNEFPDTYLVVKAHPQQLDLWEIYSEFQALSIPRSQFVTGADSSNAFTVNSDVIIGFQTTAMIEAMLTRKPVIYTGWGPEHQAMAGKLLPIHLSGGVDIPGNPEEFKETLRVRITKNASPSSEQLAHRLRFTESYFGRADGHVSEKLLDLLRRIHLKDPSLNLPPLSVLQPSGS